MLPPRLVLASTDLLYAVIVTTTGSGLFTARIVPSGRSTAGRVRSPRRMVPSDMGISRSGVTAVPPYCSLRGFQALAPLPLPLPRAAAVGARPVATVETVGAALAWAVVAVATPAIGVAVRARASSPPSRRVVRPRGGRASTGDLRSRRCVTEANDPA